MVLLFSPKPACSFLKILSTLFLILLIRTLPKILLVTDKSVIPLQFIHSLKLPFLGTFTISTLFQLFGAAQSFSLCWTTLSTPLFSLPNLFLEVLQLPYRVQAAFPLFVDFTAVFTCVGWNAPMSKSLSFCIVSISCGCMGLTGGSFVFSLSLRSFGGLPFSPLIPGAFRHVFLLHENIHKNIHATRMVLFFRERTG